MTYKRHIFFLCILTFISLQVLNAQKIENPDYEEYDIVVSIKDTAERFTLKPFQKELSPNHSNPIFKSYYLEYTKAETNLPKNLKVLEKTFITQSKDAKYNNAVINLGFWNLPRWISDKNRIVLSNEIKYSGSSTSVLFLLKDFAALSITDTNTYLFTIPFENNRDIDSIFPGLNHHSRILFILWERQLANIEYFPEEIEGLRMSITNLHTGQTDYYANYNRPASSNKSGENKRNHTNTEKITIINTAKPNNKVNNAVIVEAESIKYRLSFKLVGPKKLNFANFPDPQPIELIIPMASFNDEGAYYYDPKTDTINPHPEFALMWAISIHEKIVVYKNIRKVPLINVSRAARIKNFQFIIYGAVPKSVRIKYNISSILYYPKLTDKTQEIKGKNVYNQVTEKALVIPDTLLPEEKIRLEFQNPFNYNLSKRGEKHDWKNPTNEVVIEHSNDTIIELDFEKIPPFQFFYIDLSGFENLQKIKDLLKEKIGEQNNDYFIFVSNSSRPLIWEGEENDLDELLTRISLMRPEPASYYDETRFIKPYIDEMINDESIYSIDRREVHFNFLFSESFLNHSSQDFILKCLDALTNDDFFKDGKVKVFSFSTTDKPAYVKTDHTMDKNKITYNKL